MRPWLLIAAALALGLLAGSLALTEAIASAAAPGLQAPARTCESACRTPLPRWYTAWKNFKEWMTK